MIDAVIFDLDGTLIDSFSGILETAHEVLVAAGLPAPNLRQTERLMRRGLLLETVFIELGVEPSRIDEIMGAYRARYRRGAVLQATPFPETVPCLESLSALGLPLAVATSKRHDLALLALDASGLRAYFRDVVGHNSVALGKPHPEMVLTLAERVGVAPDRCLVVGDSLADVAMGRAAGARTCAVRCDALELAEIEEASPDYIVDHLDAVALLVRAARSSS